MAPGNLSARMPYAGCRRARGMLGTADEAQLALLRSGVGGIEPEIAVDNLEEA